MEYSNLLDLADECEDPYMQLVYSGKQFFFPSLSLPTYLPTCFHLPSLPFSVHAFTVWWTNFMLLVAASFFISVYYAFQRTWKPFNPILGETYEMVNHGGITFVAEQVSS